MKKRACYYLTYCGVLLVAFMLLDKYAPPALAIAVGSVGIAGLVVGWYKLSAP